MDESPFRLRTMIVDDDDDSAFLTRRVLERIGTFDIVGRAVDAHEARLLAAQLLPDLIMLDVEMPGADGFSALPFIQQASPGSHIVILSNADAQRTRARAARVHVDFLPKNSPGTVFEMLARSLSSQGRPHC